MAATISSSLAGCWRSVGQQALYQARLFSFPAAIIRLPHLAGGQVSTMRVFCTAGSWRRPRVLPNDCFGSSATEAVEVIRPCTSPSLRKRTCANSPRYVCLVPEAAVSNRSKTVALFDHLVG